MNQDPQIERLLSELKQTRDDIQESIAPLASNTPAANYQVSYLLSRLIDIGTIIERLGTQNARLIVLAHREDDLTPVVRPRLQFSKQLLAVLNERNSLVAKMRLDMETLYIFGNLALDHWARLVGHIYSLPRAASWRYPLSDLHKLISSTDAPIVLQQIIDTHAQEIYWLYYNLRLYRNAFVEHLDQPMQRGATLPTFRMGFSLFIPAASGTISDDEKAQIYATVAHIAPQFTDGLHERHRLRRPDASLQTMFQNIGAIERIEDREAVFKAWKKLGGETVSYEVLALRLINLIHSSTQTLKTTNPNSAA